MSLDMQVLNLYGDIVSIEGLGSVELESLSDLWDWWIVFWGVSNI